MTLLIYRCEEHLLYVIARAAEPAEAIPEVGWGSYDVVRGFSLVRVRSFAPIHRGSG